VARSAIPTRVTNHGRILLNRRVSRFVMLGTALVLAFGAAGCIPRVSPNLPNPSLGVNSTWVTGLSKPWDIAFLPSGLPVYTQNDSGVIAARVSDADTQHVLGEVSNFDGSFNNAGEGGLMGLAIDPRYNTNRRAYVCYSTNTDNRVVRFTLNPAASPAIANWTPIVTGIPHSGSHNGCRVRFQPITGALFVTTGDAEQATAPQSATSLGGKVLRIDTNGNPWPGNLFGLRIFTLGHRNPQGIAFRPYDFTPYSVEHGPDVNDEVNKLKLLGNAGWNPNSNGSYNQSVPMTNPGFQNVILPTWVSGGATVAPSGATFLTGKQWKGYENALAVAVLKDSELLIMKLNLAGTALVQAPTVVLKNGVRLRSAVQGPDGNLYITTDADAIWRVVPG
jgi:aldose sugar dehydrogenase